MLACVWCVCVCVCVLCVCVCVFMMSVCGRCGRINECDLVFFPGQVVCDQLASVATTMNTVEPV